MDVVRRQLRRYGFRDSDYQLDRALCSRIRAILPDEIREISPPGSLMILLNFLEGLDSEGPTTADVIKECRINSHKIDPQGMWNRLFWHLKTKRKNKTDKEIGSEAWYLVRQRAYEFTSFAPYIIMKTRP